MPPTMQRAWHADTRILDILLEANGEWVSKWRFIRELFLTQSGAASSSLNEHHWPIEHSKERTATVSSRIASCKRRARSRCYEKLRAWPGCHAHGMHFATS
jgi:hypothetical protein